MRGNVYFKDQFAGVIEQTDAGFRFTYDLEFCKKSDFPISATLPLTLESYESNTMFPFFDGLIPEGWLLDIATDHWKIDPRDRMQLLLTVCEDTIGAVAVKAVKK